MDGAPRRLTRTGGTGRPPAAAVAEAAGSRYGPARARTAALYGTVFAVLLVLVDWCGGGLTAPRTLCWAGLGTLLAVVLYPERTTVTATRLETRRLLLRRAVRTDRLVSAHHFAGAPARLVLCDAEGHRAEVDVGLLLSEPLAMHLLEAGVRRSAEYGTLRHGGAEVRDLARRADEEALLALERSAGLRPDG